MASRSISTGRVRSRVPTGLTRTWLASWDRVTFTAATGVSSWEMVVRWKFRKPHFSRAVLSENCFRSVEPSSRTAGSAPRMTAIRYSSPSTAAETRQRPASGVVPVLTPMALS